MYEPFVVMMKRERHRGGEVRSAAFGINLRVRHFSLISGGASAAAGCFYFKRLSLNDFVCMPEPRRIPLLAKAAALPHGGALSRKNRTVKFLVNQV
jgi:hypothetical protein